MGSAVMTAVGAAGAEAIGTGMGTDGAGTGTGTRGAAIGIGTTGAGTAGAGRIDVGDVAVAVPIAERESTRWSPLGGKVAAAEGEQEPAAAALASACPAAAAAPKLKLRGVFVGDGPFRTP